MDTVLETFLTTHESIAREAAAWAGGQILLDVALYAAWDDELDALTSSARAIILADGHVLLMSNPGGDHILPGGRREAGESLEASLRREVREETGLDLDAFERIATMHFRHTTPKPPLYRYPYPDFLNAIYLTRLSGIPALTVADTYELAGRFVPLQELRESDLPPCQWALLQLAAGATATV